MPAILAKKTLGQIADHTAEVIGKLTKKPAVMGHSTGGLITQITSATSSPAFATRCGIELR